MLPASPAAIIAFAAACPHSQAPTRLRLSTAWKPRSEISSAGAVNIPPAFATITSSRP